MNELNKYFDHTLLKADASDEQIINLCNEAITWDFYSVCVNSSHVPLAAKILSGSDVKIVSVIGFPLGACTTSTKVFEAEEALKYGAAEIDMVLNIGKLKSGDDEYVLSDIENVVSAAAEYGARVKVILETCLLSKEEIVKACTLAENGGAHFVKTSTGFNKGGATESDVSLMKQSVHPGVKVKASGGIHHLEEALAMIEAGADRIGASASVDIMKEFQEKEA